MAIKFTKKTGDMPAPLVKAEPASIPAVKPEAAKPAKKSRRKTKKPDRTEEPSLPLEGEGIHPEEPDASNDD